MANIFLINIGANTSDSAKIRSPYFPCCEEFKIAPFVASGSSKAQTVKLPQELEPYVLKGKDIKVHLDPDWKNYTYGDNCSNPRAGILRKAQKNDIFLFWGLLWDWKDNIGLTLKQKPER